MTGATILTWRQATESGGGADYDFWTGGAPPQFAIKHRRQARFPSVLDASAALNSRSGSAQEQRNVFSGTIERGNRG